jgi:hypothetical protein
MTRIRDDDDDDDETRLLRLTGLLTRYTTATESSYDYSAPPAAREGSLSSSTETSYGSLKRQLATIDGDAAMSNLFNRYRSTQSSR